MPIYYAVVARGDCILAHHSSTSGNFITVTSFLLKKISSRNSQASYSYDGSFKFHYLVEDGLTFLCMTDEFMDSKIAFAFLFEIKIQFLSKFSRVEWENATAFQMNGVFSRVIANQMDYYTHNPASEKIQEVKEKMATTQNLISDNIDKLLTRGEQIELLVGKTETTASSAKQFLEKAKEKRWQFFMRNIKYMGFLAILGLVILWLLLRL